MFRFLFILLMAVFRYSQPKEKPEKKVYPPLEETLPNMAAVDIAENKRRDISIFLKDGSVRQESIENEYAIRDGVICKKMGGKWVAVIDATGISYFSA